MKKQKYIVSFIEGEDLTIYADTENQALFLAIARKIENGLSYGADNVLEYDTRRFFVVKRDNISNVLKKI